MRKNRGVLQLVLGAILVCVCAVGVTPAYGMSAIDVSSHQNGINVQAAGTDIVIAKATEGTWYVNPDCDRVVQSSLSANKPTGVYHFANTGASPQAEADWFLNHTAGYRGRGVMPILDWEPDGSSWKTGWAKQWLDRVQSVWGVKPLIYMNLSTENSNDWSAVVSADYGLWLAGGWYYNQPLGKDQAPAPYWTLRNWPYAAMWQYTSNGRVYGWNGGVDLSEFYGDIDTWNRYAKANSVGPVAPPQQAQPQPSGGTYVVRSGDCLSLIAPRVGMSWPDLAAVNGIGPPYLIMPGQVLRTTGGQVAGGRYTVVAGDNLSSIAARHGVSVDSIRGYRSGNPNLIYAGETLYW